VVDVSQWMISHSTTSHLPAGVPENPQKLILVTCHRRENIGQRGQELIIDIISVLVTLFANSFGLFRGV
jgi:UDP-N-acetylglucosamine 2-epimerase